MSIVIIGAGYVGLPLAIAFAKYYSVICYDVDKKRIESLCAGNDHNLQHSTKEVKQKKLTFTNDANILKNKEIYIIAVPTPINSKNHPDLSMLKKASKLAGKVIKRKSYIVFESTTYPGCTEEICIPIIEKNSKMKFEKDFFVSYSPERVNPGDKINTLNNITKIVGANDPKTLNKIKIFYKKTELPILEELLEIINNIKNFKPDLILAVGGGAIIDYAKMANVVNARKDLADQIVNYSYQFKKKFTKLAVIPTTAGSGAEVTSNAVIYVDGIKHSFESELLIPDNFFLVPEFLISSPKKIKASAGFDAIAQALESLVSRKSNEQSVKFASKSLRVSVNSFVSFINDGRTNARRPKGVESFASPAIKQC